MRAGQLKNRVRFERLGAASGGYVSGSEAWSTLHTCAADIKPITGGRETEIADRLAAVGMFEIRVRYAMVISDLSPADRVFDVHSGKHFNITRVIDPTGSKRELVLTVDSGKPKG